MEHFCKNVGNQFWSPYLQDSYRNVRLSVKHDPHARKITEMIVGLLHYSAKTGTRLGQSERVEGGVKDKHI